MVVCVDLQGEKDWQKYETARNLKKCVDRLRNQYREDWKSKEMRIRQRAVALYFIDKVRLLPHAHTHAQLQVWL
jgi:DNA topoisomerase-1